jgi:hypothetical protein
VKKQLFILLSFILLTSGLNAQRVYETVKKKQAPKIDGSPTEDVWKDLNIADDFTTHRPIYGESSRFKSKVKLYYDDEAVYISGELYDPTPDSVSYTLSNRDNYGNADWFSVTIDPFGNEVNAFTFGVTSAGVEIDILEFTTSTDKSWNAVWKSATQKTEYGWSFEMKLPFSALRFPNRDVQEWKINFTRSVRRVREESNWNPIDPNELGKITQSGNLVGVKSVDAPLRLSFIPYVSGYLENSYDEALEAQTIKTRYAGGMDLKYGLNESFTLDMTLIPDFGQTTSDKQILNLGPFEVRYNENRPFFIEGTNLFRIGGVFYSRRIGASPYLNPYSSLDDSKGEEVVSNPSIAPLINASKISGRTNKGLGIGFLNAIENEAYADISDSLGNLRRERSHPFTNYSILVLSQNLKNNSTVSFVNTNVLRDGNARDANVTVLTSNLYSNTGDYKVGVTYKASNVYEDEVSSGHAFSTSLGKVAGMWQYGVSYSEESEAYDPNDLGFLYNNNSRGYNANVSWNEFTESRYFFRRSAKFTWSYRELYKPQLYGATNFQLKLTGQHKKQIYMHFTATAFPFGHHDHFDSRVFGKKIINPASGALQYFFTTDYSKRLAIDVSVKYVDYKDLDNKRHEYRINVQPRVRISDRWNFRIESTMSGFLSDWGYVSILDDNYSDQIILGVRNRQVVENSVFTEVIFTKRMGIDLRLRHYWQQVNYLNFVSLRGDGYTDPSDYNPLFDDGESQHNTSYNAFTVDVNYRWVFIPGSELRIVYKNNIFNSKSTLDSDYFNTFETLFEKPQINSLSLKLLVFVDALYFRRKNRK